MAGTPRTARPGPARPPPPPASPPAAPRCLPGLRAAAEAAAAWLGTPLLPAGTTPPSPATRCPGRPQPQPGGWGERGGEGRPERPGVGRGGPPPPPSSPPPPRLRATLPSAPFLPPEATRSLFEAKRGDFGCLGAAPPGMAYLNLKSPSPEYPRATEWGRTCLFGQESQYETFSRPKPPRCWVTEGMTHNSLTLHVCVHCTNVYCRHQVPVCWMHALVLMKVC
ncbi:formin-like protein 5 [Oxyura jamaicensis]|uniref:formin-like protein 5 n=1 Tax=Oxyura jamaicensis TaxID=8884 RepID=UPI0015A6ADF0|nr:formin-like protein 5 [Oxyura jamaicensis]